MRQDRHQGDSINAISSTTRRTNKLGRRTQQIIKIKHLKNAMKRKIQCKPNKEIAQMRQVIDQCAQSKQFHA